MKLTKRGISEKEAWSKAGITLPSYDIEKVHANTVNNPKWVHFGIGNIFRIFIGSIAEKLLEQGEMDTGLTCVETYDYEVVDRIYRPHDNLSLSVYLNSDGSVVRNVIAPFGEAIKADSTSAADWGRLKEVFTDNGLQMVSFTITEKGYALKDASGNYYGYIRKDIENGPEKATSAMAIVTAMLYERFKADKAPLTLVSMDNCSQNGRVFREAVKDMAAQWEKKGYVDSEFCSFVTDEKKVSFPWSMIDKITPRPAQKVLNDLEDLGLEDMNIVITSRQTYIAPFANAEKPQYLVIEDSFVNGRPPLEKAGVFMTDRETVNKAERMKVTVCLNPIHSALGPYGCILGMDLFSDVMKDRDMLKLAHLVGETEGMEVVEDPGIISPGAFLDECINERFPNPYLGDTSQRLTVDESQMLAIRFGETIKAHIKKHGKATHLKGMALSLAGYLRYMLGIDDNGNNFELSPDPMLEDFKEWYKDIQYGDPDSVKDALKPVLSNPSIFGLDLYECGLGAMIEEIFKDQTGGPGSVRASLKKYM